MESLHFAMGASKAFHGEICPDMKSIKKLTM